MKNWKNLPIMDKTCWNKTPKSIQCFNWRVQTLFIFVCLCLACFIQTNKKNGRKPAFFFWSIWNSLWIMTAAASPWRTTQLVLPTQPFSVLSKTAFTHPKKKMRPPFYNCSLLSSNFKPSSFLAEWHFKDIASPPPSCTVISHNYPPGTGDLN